jgi:hypothetical protein
MTYNSTNINLEYLTNPLYHQIIAKTQLKKDDAKVDVKFYRKRIVSLFKEMVKGLNPNKSLKKIHDEYIHNMVLYFQDLDSKDIIQGQYNTYTENKKDEDEDENENEKDEDDIFNIKEANDCMMRQIMNVPNLDNYVIVNSSVNDNDVRVIPLKLEINLKNPDLKTKGVKNKKTKKN